MEVDTVRGQHCSGDTRGFALRVASTRTTSRGIAHPADRVIKPGVRKARPVEQVVDAGEALGRLREEHIDEQPARAIRDALQRLSVDLLPNRHTSGVRSEWRAAIEQVVRSIRAIKPSSHRPCTLVGGRMLLRPFAFTQPQPGETIKPSSHQAKVRV